MQSLSRRVLLAFCVVVVALVGLPTVASAVAITTAAAGNWSSSSTWTNGTIPGAGDDVTINHDVVLTDNRSAKTVYVSAGKKLSFSTTASAKLTMTGNIDVRGTLEMKPSASTYVHEIFFSGVNESAFAGGEYDPATTPTPPATDVGLWVLGAGKLDLVGSPKTSWVTADGAIASGATSVSHSWANGWVSGDQVAFTPTAEGSYFDGAAFETRAISGRTSTVSFSWLNGLSQARPANTFQGQTQTAEIINLTRNVIIGGTQTASLGVQNPGRAHIFIRNTSTVTGGHKIDNVEIRGMGPRTATDKVLGRYALHFHKSDGNLVGTTVNGTVIHDGGNHAFVPHDSNGITFTNTASYNTVESAYWWDEPVQHTSENNSNDTVIDTAIAAKVNHQADENIGGFLMNAGTGNKLKNARAVGVRGNVNGAGFYWPSSNNIQPNAWEFGKPNGSTPNTNIAHNNYGHGTFFYQTDDDLHLMENYIAYHNGYQGIHHGAYSNLAKWQGPTTLLWHNGLRGNRTNMQDVGGAEVSLPASSKPPGGSGKPPIILDGIKADAKGETALLIATNTNATPGQYTKLTNWTVSGYTGTAVVLQERLGTGGENGQVDFVHWTVNTPSDGNTQLTAADFRIVKDTDTNSPTYGQETLRSGSKFRVRHRTTNYCYKVTGGTSNTDGLAAFEDIGPSPGPNADMWPSDGSCVDATP